jgi:ubiquinone/menaquinone biosynthesis C-methylase UbiE
MTDSTYYRPPLRLHALTGWYDRLAEWTAAASFLQEELAAHAAAMQPRRVLDVGCGTGNLTAALAAAVPQARIVALDPDARSLALAREKFAGALPRVQWLAGYAQAIPEPLQDFDLAASCLVFHHLDPDIKRAALQEMHRVVRPGGRALIADFDRPSSGLKRLLFNGVRLLDGAINTRAHAHGDFPAALRAAPFARVERVATYEVPIGTVGLWELVRH